MTFALTKVTAYGIEASEPLQKRFKQVLILEGTAANTNVAYDFGTYAGTYWTAVGGTEPGTSALKPSKISRSKPRPSSAPAASVCREIASCRPLTRKSWRSPRRPTAAARPRRP
jgi:hypothetical protein